LALDVSREYYELGLPIIEKAGVAHKIDFREGPALPLLDQLIQDVRLHHLPPTLFHYYISPTLFHPCTFYKLRIKKLGLIELVSINFAGKQQGGI